MTAINVSSISSSLTGSTFDWQSFVDTMMEYQSATITTLQAEQSVNTDKVSALGILEDDLTELQTASTALTASGLFTGRTASSSNSSSTWSLTASAGATTGSYEIAVTQLATASRRTGASNISEALNSTSDVSSLTLASMATSTAVTAGTLTINGTQITIATTDSLQAVFEQISTATDGAVTASYDPSTDKISLSSASEIILGSSTDTSNFFAATHLSNNGTGDLSSSSSLGAVSTTATLANSRLSTAITGTGSFLINGVSINYDADTDSLSDVISRINKSSAGVTASYDTSSDSMVLVSNSTGDMGFGLSDSDASGTSTGNFLAAVGLISDSATTTRGKNALFTINGGSTLTSSSNTLSADVTGITGLSVKVNNTGTQTITVASNTEAMKTAIQSFIDAYNLVQTYIDTQTSITVESGTVTTSTLSNNREVDRWSTELRSKAFSAVSGLSGTVSRLADMGIDFSGTSSQLTIKDSAKLTAALEDDPEGVEAFFNTASTGFAARMNTYVGTLVSAEGTSNGLIQKTEDNLLSANTDIDDQIAAIKRRLETEREKMETAFLAMQTAQTNAKSILATLESAFNTDSSDS